MLLLCFCCVTHFKGNNSVEQLFTFCFLAKILLEKFSNFSQILDMKKHLLLGLLAFALCNMCFALPGEEHKTLEIGAQAPDFKLKGVDDKMYSLASFKDASILV